MRLLQDDKITGVLAPIFALRSEGDQGIGDTFSLIEFIQWAATTGFQVVQLLPINESGNDHSPYNAISARALEPLTIRVTPEALVDLSPADHERILGEHRQPSPDADVVDYASVRALKYDLLQAAFEKFRRDEMENNSERACQFLRFVEEQREWLADYELFRALRDQHEADAWSDWPVEHRTPDAARAWLGTLEQTAREAFERTILSIRYVQWVAYRQWMSVKEAALKAGVALMGDIPFGVSRNSADVWANPQQFRLDWYGGTPPDKIFKHDEFVQKWGQNWGIPLYDWTEMEHTQYRWWRSRVRGVREFFDLFRIDHILGFYRIYAFPWLPEENAAFLPLDETAAAARTNERLPHFDPQADDTEENRAHNQESGEKLLRIILEEAGEGLVVGEDLGVVPEYVRPSLTRLGIAGYKVPQWEHDDDGGFTEGADYSRVSVATYGTHDHLPLRRIWDLIRESAVKDESGANEFRNWCDFIGLQPEPSQPFEDAHPALLRTLLRANSWLAMIMITDVLGDARRFNSPGVGGGDNWTQRLPQAVAELYAAGGSQLIKQVIAEERPVRPGTENRRAPTYDEIALRAYFIALERASGGEPSDPAKDWTEAERQLQATFS